MQKINVLVVDDEERMRTLIQTFLNIKGYNVIEAIDGVDAIEKFDDSIDLIILDVMMPRMDGFETCQVIRKTSNVPIVMLTAKAEEYDELKGFELGVNEYITKPFSPKILAARIENILKRTMETKVDIISSCGIEIFRDSHIVKIDGKEIDLSMKEFELLEYFIVNKDKALSRDTLLQDIWKYDYFGDARTIDTHVKKLRQKMGEKGDLIKTIWGLGYKFETKKA